MSEKKSGKLKVAVLAPNPSIVIDICNFLEGKIGVDSISTFQAYDAVEGKKLCEKENPDLTVIDSALIGAGGYDMARLLPSKKIIFTSDIEGFASRKNEFKNVITVLEKPIDDEVLLQIIKKKFHNKLVKLGVYLDDE